MLYRNFTIVHKWCAVFLHTIVFSMPINTATFRIYYREPINSVIYGKEKNKGV